MKLLLKLVIATMGFSCSLNAQTLVSNAFQQNQQFSPLMEVNIEAACQQNDLYKIIYSNHGSAIATDAYVVITVTNNQIIQSSSIPISTIEGNDYTFDIGDVLIGQSGFFTIELPKANLQTRCIQVHIYPDNPNQATINQYITNQNTNILNGDATNTGNNGGINTGNSAEAALSARTIAQTAATGVTGSIFEDHVILNVSGGDSINDDSGNTDLLITGNDNNNSTTNNTQNQDDRINENNSGVIDINALFSAEHCKQADNTVSNNTSILNNKETTLSAMPATTNNSTNDGKSSVDVVEVAANVYPNPFNTQATIELKGNYNQNLQLTIIDITGRVVKTQQTEKQSKIIINQDNLGQGVYVYHITNDSKLLHTGKIIVQ